MALVARVQLHCLQLIASHDFITYIYVRHTLETEAYTSTLQKQVMCSPTHTEQLQYTVKLIPSNLNKLTSL